MSYNLDEQDAEYFEFTLSGFTYKMRYPTTEELEKVQKEFEKLQKDDTSQFSMDKELEVIYQYITSDDPKAPPIQDALKKKSIKVFQRFANMVAEEFKG